MHFMALSRPDTGGEQKVVIVYFLVVDVAALLVCFNQIWT